MKSKQTNPSQTDARVHRTVARPSKVRSSGSERLRIAIEAGRMDVFEWDSATDIVDRSMHGVPMLDLPDDGSRHTRQELIERILPDDKQKYIRVLESVTPEKPEYRALYRLRLRDGHYRWLEESGRATFGPDGKLRKVIGITSDVTEVRESENTMRELSRRLITSQEEERLRVARELHDHIGQEAALLCVQAQRIESGLKDEELSSRPEVHDLYKKIQILAGDISKLSHRLHSSELSFLGLAVAAERLCHDFAAQYGIDVDYRPRSLPSQLNSDKSLCFYRVLQEALQNVGKHSRATHVSVDLRAVNNELILTVKDNGAGFDVDQTGYDAGLGLLSMRERLNLVGGQFAISSRPGSGAKLTARVTL